MAPDGVSRDYVLAYSRITIAAASGDEDARKVRELLVAKLSAEQIAEADRTAAVLKAKKLQ